jgi:hypothetical protein
VPSRFFDASACTQSRSSNLTSIDQSRRRLDVARHGQVPRGQQRVERAAPPSTLPHQVGRDDRPAPGGSQETTTSARREARRVARPGRWGRAAHFRRVCFGSAHCVLLATVQNATGRSRARCRAASFAVSPAPRRPAPGAPSSGARQPRDHLERPPRRSFVAPRPRPVLMTGRACPANRQAPSSNRTVLQGAGGPCRSGRRVSCPDLSEDYVRRRGCPIRALARPPVKQLVGSLGPTEPVRLPPHRNADGWIAARRLSRPGTTSVRLQVAYDCHLSARRRFPRRLASCRGTYVLGPTPAGLRRRTPACLIGGGQRHKRERRAASCARRTSALLETIRLKCFGGLAEVVGIGTASRCPGVSSSSRFRAARIFKIPRHVDAPEVAGGAHPQPSCRSGPLERDEPRQGTSRQRARGHLCSQPAPEGRVLRPRHPVRP